MTLVRVQHSQWSWSVLSLSLPDTRKTILDMQASAARAIAPTCGFVQRGFGTGAGYTKSAGHGGVCEEGCMGGNVTRVEPERVLAAASQLEGSQTRLMEAVGRLHREVSGLVGTDWISDAADGFESVWTDWWETATELLTEFGDRIEAIRGFVASTVTVDEDNTAQVVNVFEGLIE